MNESNSLAIVKQLYEVIEKGDYSLLTPLLTDDIQWYGLTLDQQLEAKFLQDIPSVIKFFEITDQVLETHWIPETMMSQGDRVMVVGKSHHTSKLTNYCFEDKWVHLVMVRQGKIAEFHTYLDSFTLLGVSN